jgi:molecular chaperone GrpE
MVKSMNTMVFLWAKQPVGCVLTRCIDSVRQPCHDWVNQRMIHATNNGERTMTQEKSSVTEQKNDKTSPKSAAAKDWSAVKAKAAAQEGQQKPQQDASTQHPEEGESRVQPTPKPESIDANKIKELEQKITQMKGQLDEYKDIMMRSKAEVENMRQRTQREVERAHAFGMERFVKALLPVIDSLEQAIQNEPEGDKPSGVKITYDMFIKHLSGFHVQRVGQVGEAFNAQYHEAVSMQAAKDGAASNTIQSVVRPGYTLNDRVVRAAMVVVNQ